MQRIGVLNGNNITYDHDFAGLVRGLTDGGIIQGGEISGNKVQPVQAVIACQRSNGQKLMLYFESDEQVTIPSSGTFKVYIEVNQAKVDDGSENAENGTGIASIKTGPSVPSQNSLLLASVADGSITDERNLIPKIQSVAQRTGTLEEKIQTQEGKISQLEEAGGNENFSKKGLIGASYEDGDTLYFNKILKLYEASSYTLAWNTSHKKVYFIAMANGESFNSLSVPFYRIQNPMDGMSLEIRNAVPHTGDEKIKYKPGEIIYATGNVLPTSIDLTSKMIEITLNNPVNVAKGTLIAVVISRNLPQDVNNNYHIPSGAMTNNGPVGINRYIGINSTDTPVMIGGGAVACICSGMEQECYTKSKLNLNKGNLTSTFRLNSGASNYVAQQQLGTIGVGKYRAIVYIQSTNHSPQGNTFELKLNGVKIKQLPNPNNTNNQTFDIGEIDILSSGTLSISCKMNTSSSGYYLEGYVALTNTADDKFEIEYIPEQVSDLGTMQKLIYYGMVKNNRKGLYDKKAITINKTITVTSSGSSATANWNAPSDGLLEVSWVAGGRYDSDYTQTRINNKDLTWGWSRGSGGEIELKCYGRIFVPRGVVTAYCYKRYTNINPSITLISFIPL